jgi:hypothetical protein
MPRNWAEWKRTNRREKVPAQGISREKLLNYVRATLRNRMVEAKRVPQSLLAHSSSSGARRTTSNVARQRQKMAENECRELQCRVVMKTAVCWTAHMMCCKDLGITRILGTRCLSEAGSKLVARDLKKIYQADRAIRRPLLA